MNALADEGATFVKVIQLKNRQAADLVVALQMLAGPGGAIVALDSRLVVRATQKGHARIEEALRALDTPLRSLVITVSQARSRATSQETSAVSAAGGTVAEPPGRTVVSGAFGASSDSEADADVQSVAALEGHPALIRVGRSEPVATIGLLPMPGGPGVLVPGTAYAETGTGFYVLVRLDAHRVTLELWVEDTEGAGGGALAGPSPRTTMGGSLGQWMEVGSALREAEVRARALVGGGEPKGVLERSVRMRVVEVP